MSGDPLQPDSKEREKIPARCAREFEVEKYGEKGQSESLIREDKWQTCWYYREQQELAEWRMNSAKKLEQTGPAEKEGWTQGHNDSSWQGRPSRLCQKKRAISPDHQIVR